MLQNLFIFIVANQHAGKLNHATWELFVSCIMKTNGTLNLVIWLCKNSFLWQQWLYFAVCGKPCTMRLVNHAKWGWKKGEKKALCILGVFQAGGLARCWKSCSLWADFKAENISIDGEVLKCSENYWICYCDFKNMMIFNGKYLPGLGRL